MNKIKTIKIKNLDGSVSEETYTISVDAKDVDMANGKELQETIGTIDIDTDGNIAEQLENLNDNVDDLNIDIKKKAYFFDTVADMKNANLKVGDYVCTLGYYEANDGGAGNYQVVNGDYTDDGGSYHKLKNNLFVKLIFDKVIDVRQFGAKNDATSDSSDALNVALNFPVDVINCFGNFFVTKSIVISSINRNKTFNFEGNILFDNDFTGDYVFKILNTIIGHISFNNLVLSHILFYNTDKNYVQNTVRTTFGGLYLNKARLMIFNTLQIMGISTNALRCSGDSSAIRLSKGYIWGSNLTNENALKLDAPDDLTSEQNSRYTYGVILGTNDSNIENLIVAGFNIGMLIPSATQIVNYHPWAYKCSMVYGAVVVGSQNMLTNTYIDTVNSIGDRIGAGIYEVRRGEGLGDLITPNRNNYSNTIGLAIASDCYLFELGDDANVSASCFTTVQGLSQNYGSGENYLLHGGAIGNPLLDNCYGRVQREEFIDENKLKYDNTAITIEDVLISIVHNYFNTDLGTTPINSCVINFATTKFNNLWTNGFENSLDNKLCYRILKIERQIYVCEVERYGYPTSDKVEIKIFDRIDSTPIFYYRNISGIKPVTTKPIASNYTVGSCIFFNNKPYWRSTDGKWLDANGTELS